MTLKELSQLYYLKREIQIDSDRLGQIEDDDDKRIQELTDSIREKKERCIEEKMRLEEYIDSIPDSLTRMVFTLRFVEGKNWVQVAHRIGGGNTASGVKKICYRFIKRGY